MLFHNLNVIMGIQQNPCKESGAPGDPPRRGTPDLLVSAAGGLYPAGFSPDARILFISSRPCPDLKNRSLRIASERVLNSS